MGDANNIVVAQMARVYLAPIGTAAPTDPVTAMPTAWREVGLFTPDSLAARSVPRPPWAASRWGRPSPCRPGSSSTRAAPAPTASAACSPRSR